MANNQIEARVSQALVEFASHGVFPNEEDISAAIANGSVISAARIALENAKTTLETEIRQISRESAPNVESWMANAKALQADIDKSRKLASEIVRQAEAQEHSPLEEQEAHVAFLQREATFNSQLGEALESIKEVDIQLKQVDRLTSEKRILDSLRTLDDVYATIEAIPVSPQAVRLLYKKYSEKKDFIFDSFRNIWASLIDIDVESSTITFNSNAIFEHNPDVNYRPTNISDAVTILQSYKKLDDFAVQLWDDVDRVLLGPRTDIRKTPLHSLEIRGNTVSLSNAVPENNIKSLLEDVENFIQLLKNNLPTDILKPFANVMMPVISTRIKHEWLDRSVPTSLDDLTNYQVTLAHVDEFATKLKVMNWPGSDTFGAWVREAPLTWLTKRRETALDTVRNHLELGVGQQTIVQHVETQMVSRHEGNDLASTANVVNDDWNSGWDSDDNEGDKGTEKIDAALLSTSETEKESEDADDADAWGWGDDDNAADIAPEPPQAPPLTERPASGRREVTLSEDFHISSMPLPILELITGIYDDGAKLANMESSPIAKAAAGLFGLPTLVLAMYRAVSPYYYAQDMCGNMYNYNDTIWLSDRLLEYSLSWQARKTNGEISPSTFGKVKLEQEIKDLKSFGKRAYAAEMARQKQIIHDHLGGVQNVFEEGDAEQSIETVIIHIRTTAASWSTILAASARSSAVGRLVNILASKIITDTFDLPDIDTDQAQQIAAIILRVVELDDLFTETHSADGQNGKKPVPQTARFADKWIKLQFLSEVLQSNLDDIRYQWFQSDLSMEMTKTEVLGLIDASFADNAKSQKLKKDIALSQVTPA